MTHTQACSQGNTNKENWKVLLEAVNAWYCIITRELIPWSEPFILYLVVLPWCFWHKRLCQPDPLVREWRGDNSYVAIWHLIQFVVHAFTNGDLLSENAQVFLVQCLPIPKATWTERSVNQLKWNRCPGFSLCWILSVSKSHKIWHQLLSVRSILTLSRAQAKLWWEKLKKFWNSKIYWCYDFGKLKKVDVLVKSTFWLSWVSFLFSLIVQLNFIYHDHHQRCVIWSWCPQEWTQQ